MIQLHFIKWLREVRKDDKPTVGGKGANLGEMIINLTQAGVRVPNGFVVTTDGWRRFAEENNLTQRIEESLKAIDFSNPKSLQSLSWKVWQIVEQSHMPQDLADEIRQSYEELEREFRKGIDVAVRSSAIAEDIEDASFAGQYETFLNIRGEEEVILGVRNCFASLFNERAIAYRHEKDFSLVPEGIAVVVQKMVRSDRASSGVMFTIDTTSAFPDVIGIEAGWGLGEPIVRGLVTPDEYLVSKALFKEGKPAIIGKTVGAKERKMEYSYRTAEKTVMHETPKEERDQFVLSDEEVFELARMALQIEDHYGHPVDIEWAKDGDPSVDPRMTGELFIVQARPVTGLPNPLIREHLKILEKTEVAIEGLAAGPGAGKGQVQIIEEEYHKERFVPGNVLVTTMTDPAWVPIMKKAAAIVTDQGGRKCHAAIVARELGIPCIVGTSRATKVLRDGEEVTVDCNSGGEIGKVYRGALKSEIEIEDLRPSHKMKKLIPNPKIMMILGDPWVSWRESFRPNDGIGLARLEFIIANTIGVHPKAVLEENPSQVFGTEVYEKICARAKGYESLREYFVNRLAQGVAQLAASVWPKPIIVRFSDFKTNEYRQLLGGEQHEPHEENPMLGWRGASRYYHPLYQQAFFLECEAIKKAREELGFSNIKVMVPFCRTPEEGRKVLGVMEEAGFAKGREGLEVGMMCEIPSNVIMAEEFGALFDFFSIGSNDLTQLVFGLDRDNEMIVSVADERHPAMLRFLTELFERTRRVGISVGICGQGPSLYPELTQFLVEQGIESISVMPDAIPRTIELVAQIQQKDKRQKNSGT
jgi:pyruvate,water dikinase